MYNLDLNFEDAGGRDVDSDYEYESDTDSVEQTDNSSWGTLDRRLLQRILSFLPRQSDRRAFSMVNKDWAVVGEPSLWAYPEFSTPEQLASFLRVVTESAGTYGPQIRGIRFTLRSHYDRHLTSTSYCDDTDSSADAELPTLLELAQGRHVLSADPAVLRNLLHGSDLSSPPLAMKFARLCSPIDSLSVYGFRMRDKYIINDMMRWNLRELEIIGLPKKPLANLGYLFYGMRSLTALRVESDVPLPKDVWGPLSLRLAGLSKLRLWAPGIAGSQLLRASGPVPQRMDVLHLVGSGNDISDDAVVRILNGSPQMQSLVVHSANITHRSAAAALATCPSLIHLELARDTPEVSDPGSVDTSAPVAATRLNTLALRNLAVGDELICSAATLVSALRTLHISGAPTLTGNALGSLLHNTTRLASLGLHDCPQLSDAAFSGLAQSSSVSTLRAVVINQCAMQSDGIERILPLLTSIKHFKVVGTEVVRQQFQYAYKAPVASTEMAPEDVRPPVSIQRSFVPVYPEGHFFTRSESQSRDVASTIAAEEVSEPAPSRRFVPGLMAFSRCQLDEVANSSVAGRRRATTVSADESPYVPEVVSRPRSLSEIPESADPGSAEQCDESATAADVIPEDVGEARDLELEIAPEGVAVVAVDEAIDRISEESLVATDVVAEDQDSTEQTSRLVDDGGAAPDLATAAADPATDLSAEPVSEVVSVLAAGPHIDGAAEESPRDVAIDAAADSSADPASEAPAEAVIDESDDTSREIATDSVPVSANLVAETTDVPADAAMESVSEEPVEQVTEINAEYSAESSLIVAEESTSREVVDTVDEIA
ncbi:hypothetical protein GGI15_004320, partial [Coemansia interrupta]